MMTLLDLTGDEIVPGHRGCHLSYLRNTSLFSELSDEELSCFLTAAQARAYKKGKILYIEEEPAEFFYVICSGWIKLFHTMPEGDEVIIDMLTAGHTAGESSIFERGHHTSSAQVIEDVQLLVIPSRTLEEQIRRNPTLALCMLSMMSRHYRRRHGEIALNAMQSAPQRIGSFLLKLCPRDKKTDIVFHFPYDKTLIAHMLGMKGATFSRALNILREKAGIRISGRRIEISSIDSLIYFVYGPLSIQNMRLHTGES